jgi:hypothetical protein
MAKEFVVMTSEQGRIQPLREALAEAVADVLGAANLDDQQPTDRTTYDAAVERVAFLIEQIPLVFEAHEPNVE